MTTACTVRISGIFCNTKISNNKFFVSDIFIVMSHTQSWVPPWRGLRLVLQPLELSNELSSLVATTLGVNEDQQRLTVLVRQGLDL